MSKFIQALLSGVFFTFILDFFIFLGIFLHYIKPLEIDVYYNILFTDNQNIFIFIFFTFLIGYLNIYCSIKKLSIMIISILFILATSTLIPFIGNFLGKTILMQKDKIFYEQKHTFRGDIYYDGRNNITFYDYELKKIILLDKTKLISKTKD